jgi:hypothetical protein
MEEQSGVTKEQALANVAAEWAKFATYVEPRLYLVGTDGKRNPVVYDASGLQGIAAGTLVINRYHHPGYTGSTNANFASDWATSAAQRQTAFGAVKAQIEVLTAALEALYDDTADDEALVDDMKAFVAGDFTMPGGAAFASDAGRAFYSVNGGSGVGALIELYNGFVPTKPSNISGRNLDAVSFSPMGTP